MKKTILLALALVVSASFSPVEAIKKKNKEVVFPAQPVVLNNSSDSLSYAAGVALTNGLVTYLLQQKMDTTLMADFARGLREGVRSADDPKQKAYMIGLDIARQVNERMLPGITEEFKDSPDSIIGDLLCKGFIDAIEGDSPFSLTLLPRSCSLRNVLPISWLRRISFMVRTVMLVRNS